MDKHRSDLVYHLCFRNKELIKFWINCFRKASKDPVWNDLTWVENTAQLISSIECQNSAEPQLLGYTLPVANIPENA